VKKVSRGIAFLFEGKGKKRLICRGEKEAGPGALVKFKGDLVYCREDHAWGKQTEGKTTCRGKKHGTEEKKA